MAVEPRCCDACGEALPQGWTGDCCGSASCRLELHLARPRKRRQPVCDVCGEPIPGGGNLLLTCGKESCRKEHDQRVRSEYYRTSAYDEDADPLKGKQVVHVLKLTTMPNHKLIKMFKEYAKGKIVWWKTVE
jgi:predicted nucleic acid-binding Zn ribbon protein